MEVLEWLASALFSAPCPGCGEGGHGGRCCDDCFASLPRLRRSPACALCGDPFEPEVLGLGPTARCSRCLVGRPFARARSLGPFQDRLHDWVVAVKFAGKRSLGYDLGWRMARALAEDLGEIDAVVPVPLSARRLRQRGYNQAEVVAAGVAAALGLPLERGRLVRTRETRPQTELSRTARLENVRGAFRLRGELLVRRVLLVDDVMTTGATVEAAARALRRGGEVEVVVLTLARAGVAESGIARLR